MRGNRTVLVLSAIVAAVMTIAVVVAVGGSKDRARVSDASPSTSVDPDGGSQGHESAADARTAALLDGVRQNGHVLGNPEAGVALLEFTDLQCPSCRDYTVSTFPKLVATYVKAGKVKMVFQNYAFIGPDSLNAARAAEAAGNQNKLWHFVDVFYNNQRDENTDYVTDDFLTKIAGGAGVDAKKMLADRQNPKVDEAIAKAQQAAQQAGVNSTPTFVIKKAGSPPQKVSAAEVEAALAKAVGQ
jgi:protein-disulfide isomerase